MSIKAALAFHYICLNVNTSGCLHQYHQPLLEMASISAENIIISDIISIFTFWKPQKLPVVVGTCRAAAEKRFFSKPHSS